VTGLDVDVCVFMIGANDMGMVRWDVHPMLGGDAFYPQARWSRPLQDLLRYTQISRHLHHLRTGLRSPRTEPYFAAEARRQAAMPPSLEPVRLSEVGLANYARNVVTLAGICKEHGAAVLFTTQPCMFPAQPSAEELEVFWGCHDGEHAITPANFTAHLDRVNERLLSTCVQRGYACVDLAALIPKGLGSFYDQVHFNEAGARRVAEALVGPVIALVP
jgi:lysophospholipase L1-like esterase